MMFTSKRYEPGQTIHEVKLPSGETMAIKAPDGKPSWVILYNDQLFYTRTILSDKPQLEIYGQESAALAQCELLNQYGFPIGKEE